MQSQKKYIQKISCEFFPPKTEQGRAKLVNTINELKQLKPSYISVTCGAAGTHQNGTFETVLDIKQKGIDASPHLTCIGASKSSLRDVLVQYKDNGVNRIVALRGDMPPNCNESGEFLYASELVNFIRQEFGEYFHIDVAAYPEFHPQSENAFVDLQSFKQKVEQGANGAITQYFYSIDAYLRFIDDCEKMGLELPIVPGIMPIVNYTQLARLSDACGAEIPRWLRQRLVAYADDLDSLRDYGVEVTSELCASLLKIGAPGLHFYTMNQSETTLTVCRNLDII